MKLSAASVVSLGLPAVISGGVIECAAAEKFPSRPIRFLVAFPPGGGADTLARVVGQELAERVGQQVVIDNRAGAGGNLAAEIAARAAPDGHTLLQATVGHAISTSLYQKLGFDLVRDFAPVSLLASTPFVLVATPSLAATSVNELKALAKAKQLNYASSGNGSPSHLAMEMFRSAAQLELQHIPYKGVAPATTDLLGGQVMMMFSTIAPALPLIRAGKLRPIGLASRTRSATAPDVPTISESGVPGFEASTWFGVLVPTGTPRPVVAALNSDLAAILKQPATRARLVTQGFDVIGSSPEEFAAHIRAEIPKWAEAIKRSGARID
ncbi:MAG: tripartite tricarboxylate transporter substrate binding protein [Proteobacteria bacterium]|nr:tripartite tricarboxylate transporter substrate binding protein [Burkholderiales bacterium]